MKKILSSLASIDSAMRLRCAIEDRLGLPRKTILVSSSSKACAGHDVILRYGCGYGSLKVEPRWGNREFTRLCVDKEKTSDLLKKYTPVPEFMYASVPAIYPVLIRETLTGCQSEGIHLVNNEKEFAKIIKPGFYWTHYFKHDIEVRVNAVFLKDRIETRIYKKVPTDPNKTTTDFIPGLVGVEDSEWLLKDKKYYPKVLKVLDRIYDPIVKAGGIFVGVDMIYAPEIQDYVVLELNSGPVLTPPAADWLAGIFIADNKEIL